MKKWFFLINGVNFVFFFKYKDEVFLEILSYKEKKYDCVVFFYIVMF